jgi:DNA-binding beta-propeller fold protein YncE
VFVANLGFQSARTSDAVRGSITVIDARSESVITTVALPGHPTNLAISSSLHHLYVSGLELSGRDARVWVIDTETGSPLGDIQVGLPGALAFSERYQALYVVRPSGPGEPEGETLVSIVDPRTNAVSSLGRFQRAGPIAVRNSVDPGTQRLYLAESFPDGGGRLWIMNLGSASDLSRLTALGLPSAAAAIAADDGSGRIYVASPSAGVVAVIREENPWP